MFLDARTAIGTAPSPDGRALRLVLRGAEGEVRELRRRPLSASTSFDAFTAEDDTAAWAETGEEGLLVHDLGTGRTVDLSASASGAFIRNGVVWWSTGDQDHLVWHTVDLRAVGPPAGPAAGS
ncbi:MAG TPA: hypothetical protein VFR35_14715 [Actinoplanes sp.]|nr:hypothetical protein [Actinoplanes sp.]